LTAEVWAAVVAASLAASGLLLAYAHAKTRGVIRTMPAEFEDRALALFALGRRSAYVPILGAVGVLIAWKSGEAVAPHAVRTWEFAVFWTTFVVLTAANAWIVSEAQVAIRPPQWSRTAYVAGGMQGAAMMLFPLLLLGWVAPLMLTGSRPVPGEPDPAMPLSYVAGLALGASLASLWGPLRRPGGEPPPELMAAFKAAAHGPVPRVRTIDTRASGLTNAYAFRQRGKEEIVISAELLDEVTTAEAASFLLHELGHHRLGHIRRRTRTLRIGFIVVALLPAVFHATSPFVVAALHLVLLSVILPRSWQRQEIEADLYAAARCGAGTTGDALRKLHRARFAPLTFGSREKRMTHPGLARRLAALAAPAAS
jgi:Zn-dependent protease with chaperone function